jgi:predicted acetyltransferase
MADPTTVSLAEATPADAALLSNLLELYIHDLSAIFTDVELGEDGRFGYPKLGLYWSEPTERFAFLIRCGGCVAGFALVTRGSPAAEDPQVLDVAEFFVLRRYRRSGVGRRAASLLWRALPGEWTVRVAESNPAALEFWRDVVAELGAGAARESQRPGPRTAWCVFHFETKLGS